MAAEREEAKTALGLRSSWLVSTPCLWGFLALAVLAILTRMTFLASFLVFLLLLCCTSRLWGEYALRKISFSVHGEPARLFPGEETTIECIVVNEKFLPMIWLEFAIGLSPDSPLWPAESEGIRLSEDPLVGEDGRFYPALRRRFSFLMPHQRLCWSSVWTAKHRGLFSLDHMLLCSGDGLGLTQTERRAPGGSQVFAVYPRLQHVTVDPFLRKLWEAVGDAKGHLEDPTIIKGTRGYQPTDPWKRINWRMTARGLPLSVNLFETILPKSALFVVDGESFSGPPADDEGFEEMLSILASILLGLDAAQVRCGLTLPRAKQSAPITYPCGTPVHELLFALSGYDRLPPESPEQGSDAPQAKPSRFDLSPALSAASAAGRCYYLCRDLNSLGGSLLTRLEPSSLVLMPLRIGTETPRTSLGATILPLTGLKRGDSLAV